MYEVGLILVKCDPIWLALMPGTIGSTCPEFG